MKINTAIQISDPLFLFAALALSWLTCTASAQNRIDVAPGSVSAKHNTVRSAPLSWPFQPWSSAKAYTFNNFNMAPGIPLYIYTNKDGWSPHIKSEMEISKALGIRAISLVNRTKGTIEISQCPFPRHAIVFFDTNGKPIASVNVCFECGDILVWPPYFKSKKQEAEKYSLLNPQTEEPLILKAYDDVYPLWMDLFGNDLNMQINFSAP